MIRKFSEYTIEGRKSLTTEKFIEMAKKIHGDRYDYSKVNYINSQTPIEIICKEHGIFEQRPTMHLYGQGCPMCGGKLKSNTEEFIKKAKKIHDDRYDYSKVNYINALTTIEIICKEHGLFTQSPPGHLKGQGCPRCGGTGKLNTEEFIKMSKKIHGDKYDYSKVNYKGSMDKVEIICKNHENPISFMQSPNAHLIGKGCPFCAIRGKYKVKLSSTKEFIEKSKKIHGDKYDYSKVNYKNAHDKVEIICKNHDMPKIFMQSPSNHLGGKGCPFCNESKGEKNIARSLIELNIKFERNKPFNDCISDIGRKLPFDFYLPDHNLCIEYDGLQHFVPSIWFGGEDSFKLQQRRDIIKNEYCKIKNIKLLRISYKVSGYNNIFNYLKDFFKDYK